MGWPGPGSWPRRLLFSIIQEDGAASANVHSVSSCLEFSLVPGLVQFGSEFLKKTYRKAQTRIPCVAIVNFKWFLEVGSDLVQVGSYISHLPPVDKSVQAVRGFLENHGGGGSIDIATSSHKHHASHDPRVARPRYLPSLFVCQGNFASS